MKLRQETAMAFQIFSFVSCSDLQQKIPLQWWVMVDPDHSPESSCSKSSMASRVVGLSLEIVNFKNARFRRTTDAFGLSAMDPRDMQQKTTQGIHLV